MSETETVILCTHDGQSEHLWQPGDECPDAIPAGTWSVRPAYLADATDPRFTDGQRAHLARFEAAPAAPESFDPIAVEGEWQKQLTKAVETSARIFHAALAPQAER